MHRGRNQDRYRFVFVLQMEFFINAVAEAVSSPSAPRREGGLPNLFSKEGMFEEGVLTRMANFAGPSPTPSWTRKC